MNSKLRAMMDQYGTELSAQIVERVAILNGRGVRAPTEFETIWNLAENEGRKAELKEFLKVLQNI